MRVKPFNGGEKGDGSGWWGCEYFNGWMREKYRPISSVEGGGRRIPLDLPPPGADASTICPDDPDSAIAAAGKKVAAVGAEA